MEFTAEGEACLACARPMGVDEDLVYCEDCRTFAHRACWREAGSCPSPSCSNTEYRRLKRACDQASKGKSGRCRSGSESGEEHGVAPAGIVEGWIVPNLRVLLAISGMGLPLCLLLAVLTESLYLVFLAACFAVFLLWYLFTDYEPPEPVFEEEQEEDDEEDGPVLKHLRDWQIHKNKRERRRRKRFRQAEKSRKRARLKAKRKRRRK